MLPVAAAAGKKKPAAATNEGCAAIPKVPSTLRRLSAEKSTYGDGQKHRPNIATEMTRSPAQPSDWWDLVGFGPKALLCRVLVLKTLLPSEAEASQLTGPFRSGSKAHQCASWAIKLGSLGVPTTGPATLGGL